MIEKLKANASGILTGVGCAGVIATAYFASEESADAAAAVKEKKPTNVYEHLMAVIPKRKKTIASATITMVCIIGSHTIDARNLAKLAGSYAAIGGAFSRYKNVAKRYLNDEQYEELEEQFEAEEEELKSDQEIMHWFYEPVTGRLFEATWKDYYDSISDARKILTLEGELKFNEFLYFLGIVDAKPLPKDIGWDTGDLECGYAYSWLDVEPILRNDPNGDEIDFNFNDGRPTYELHYPIYPMRMGSIVGDR